MPPTAMKAKTARQPMKAKAKSKAKAKAKVMVMKATKAKASKNKGMRATFHKTKVWSATWVGMYYEWELVELKWDKDHVIETWKATLLPGWKKLQAMTAMKAMKAMKANK